MFSSVMPCKGSRGWEAGEVMSVLIVEGAVGRGDFGDQGFEGVGDEELVFNTKSFSPTRVRVGIRLRSS